MSKLNVDQKTIKELFQDKKADFLIPDYQRPYAWGEAECQTLWDDIFSFAIPDEGRIEFDSNSEYFLGPIVTFRNLNSKLEVIDGQQRLTTLMLLLRAFYTKFGHMQDRASIATKQNIEKCIWKTDEFGEPDMAALKIDSEVATDKDKHEFLDILRTGTVKPGEKSRYAANFKFFQDCIDSFLAKYPTYFAYLPTRIMNNCILLPIEAESQDTALRIFSTLNDRGMPLSDSDIFKAQFYKFYTAKGEKDIFIKRWMGLEELSEKIFHPQNGTPMDELFTRYMYFVRAQMGIKSIWRLAAMAKPMISNMTISTHTCVVVIHTSWPKKEYLNTPCIIKSILSAPDNRIPCSIVSPPYCLFCCSSVTSPSFGASASSAVCGAVLSSAVSSGIAWGIGSVSWNSLLHNLWVSGCRNAVTFIHIT